VRKKRLRRRGFCCIIIFGNLFMNLAGVFVGDFTWENGGGLGRGTLRDPENTELRRNSLFPT
jgi:hypothetical protein